MAPVRKAEVLIRGFAETFKNLFRGIMRALFNLVEYKTGPRRRIEQLQNVPS